MATMSQIGGFSTKILLPVAARAAVSLVLFFVAPSVNRGQEQPPVAELLQRFNSTAVFWQQMEVAKAIVAAKDISVLAKLQPWLTHEDRHLRGNAAFVYAALGDSAGFDVITAILRDHSPRLLGQGIPGGRWSIQAQIRADRYYAAHLLGDLKDPRGVPFLVPLLKDTQVNSVVPWSLGQIGDKTAIGPLMQALSDQNPSIRVLAIHALVDLKATEALPRLSELLGNKERSNFGKLESVAEAATGAIAKLQSETPR
jgi:HEAT repeat protein